MSQSAPCNVKEDGMSEMIVIDASILWGRDYTNYGQDFIVYSKLAYFLTIRRPCTRYIK